MPICCHDIHGTDIQWVSMYSIVLLARTLHELSRHLFRMISHGSTQGCTMHVHLLPPGFSFLVPSFPALHDHPPVCSDSTILYQGGHVNRFTSCCWLVVPGERVLCPSADWSQSLAGSTPSRCTLRLRTSKRHHRERLGTGKSCIVA
jgi:hypothetical protein